MRGIIREFIGFIGAWRHYRWEIKRIMRERDLLSEKVVLQAKMNSMMEAYGPERLFWKDNKIERFQQLRERYNIVKCELQKFGYGDGGLH